MHTEHLVLRDLLLLQELMQIPVAVSQGSEGFAGALHVFL